MRLYLCSILLNGSHPVIKAQPNNEDWNKRYAKIAFEDSEFDFTCFYGVFHDFISFDLVSAQKYILDKMPFFKDESNWIEKCENKHEIDRHGIILRLESLCVTQMNDKQRLAYFDNAMRVLDVFYDSYAMVVGSKILTRKEMCDE